MSDIENFQQATTAVDAVKQTSKKPRLNFSMTKWEKFDWSCYGVSNERAFCKQAMQEHFVQWYIINESTKGRKKWQKWILFEKNFIYLS